MDLIIDFLKEYANVLNICIALGLIISAIIIEFFFKPIRKISRYIIKIRLKKNLSTYYLPEVVEKAYKYYIKTQFQNVSPEIEEELKDNATHIAKQDAIKHFIKAFKQRDRYKHYLVLAGAGMGKTTFLINLYLKYMCKIFIFSEKKIELIPMGMSIDDLLKKIEKIENQRNTILLLDAFDESQDAVNDYTITLKKILDNTKDFHKIVITCRRQFFPNEDESESCLYTSIPIAGADGFYKFTKMYLSPFDEKDIDNYLNKKYSIFSFSFKKKQRAKEIVNNSSLLMVRPMLLSYIDDLIDTKQNYECSFQIYETLIDKWIEREAQKVKFNPIEQGKFKEDLYKFSKLIAVYMYENKEKNAGFHIKYDEIEKFAEDNSIELDKMDYTSRSLLNRGTDEYKFAHKSILEYFLALEAPKNQNFLNKFNFIGMDQARKFLDEFAYLKIQEAYKKINLDWKIKDKGRNLLKIKLSSELIRANLGNANLINANLGNVDLSDANLICANLICANLINANLINANLMYTKLICANLSNANLSNADLSNADLSNANIRYANLSNTDLTDAYLSHAKYNNKTIFSSSLLKEFSNDVNQLANHFNMIKID